MTPAVALRCPNCKRQLEAHSWHDDASGECRLCGTSFEFLAFPRLTATTARIAPQAAELAADSVCFFHAQNRAEAICDGCGRLVCAICAVPFMGKRLCPVCIAATAKAGEEPVAVKSRVLHGNIALTLAVAPIATVFLFWFSLITGPMALAWVIYAWNKPGSLVSGRGRWRLIVAGIFALAEIAGWAFVFTARWLRH